MATELGTVRQIFRYPVKSMAGEPLDGAMFDARGMRGDRNWRMRDVATGQLVGAKQVPELMGLRACYPTRDSTAVAQIELPDGESVATDSADCAKRLSNALGREVAVEGVRPADDLEFYRNRTQLPDDVQGYLRAMFARTPDEPLPDLSKFPPEIFQYSSPPGTFFDAYPVLLMTSQGLAHLQKAAAKSRFDVRRFRPNLLVDAHSSSAPVPEHEWCGRTLRIGEVRLGIEMECPRCVMTTLGFDDLPKDPTIMRTLVRESGGNLGVYATIAAGGPVGVGDRVEFDD